jgi:hypothetical protein
MMTAPAFLLWLLIPVVAPGGAAPQVATGDPGREPAACRTCHQKISDTYLRTAHAQTSAEARARTIKGDFSEGHNRLRTKVAGTFFEMVERDGRFYQVAFESGRMGTRSEPFDLVVGSGRKGQSYLYWKDGRLFQLPVSYLVGPQTWINSPGYPDGVVDFERPIHPRCLECHATSFRAEPGPGGWRFSSAYQLGLTCEKCHGAGDQHAAYHASNPGDSGGKHIFNPARVARSVRLDGCGLCHSGGRELLGPPFSYRPGARLDEYLLPHSPQDTSVPDVHGNQVGLLQRSKCFRSSPDMSCSTCHDVHQTRRDLSQLAQKCLGCHQTSQHKMAARIGPRLVSACVDCHMPNQRSGALAITQPTGESGVQYRSHAIGIYPEVAATVLQSSPRP